MTFQRLQQNLRDALNRRIEAGQLTGLQLAHETGFQQAHISNFLNCKRGLSLEGMDKVLESQSMSILDLLEPAEINLRASIPPPAEEGYENIFLVDAVTAVCDALITKRKIRDILKFKRSFLRRLKPDALSPRENWTRFVLIRMGQEAMSMYPRIQPGAIVLIDRHYNSLKPYRKGERNMYALRKAGACTIRYVEVAGNNLILRPHNQTHPVNIIPISDKSSIADHTIGRICYVGLET